MKILNNKDKVLFVFILIIINFFVLIPTINAYNTEEVVLKNTNICACSKQIGENCILAQEITMPSDVFNLTRVGFMFDQIDGGNMQDSIKVGIYHGTEPTDPDNTETWDSGSKWSYIYIKEAENQWIYFFLSGLAVNPGETYTLLILNYGIDNLRCQVSNDVSDNNIGDMKYWIEDEGWIDESSYDTRFKLFGNYIEGGNPPIAEFSASPTEGDAPLNVQFTDKTTNNPTSWSWDFNGDDIEDSTEHNPTYQYTEPGVYDVSLTVVNSKGSDTKTKTDYITVTAEDNDEYTLKKTIVGCGDIDLDPPGGIYEEGTEVTLTAIPGDGWCFNHWEGDLTGFTNPKTITMNCNKEIIASFEYEESEELNVDAGGPYIASKGKSIQFYGEVEGGTPPYKYNWDFGDETNSNNQNPTHSYSEVGVYQIDLKVEDSTGQIASYFTYAAIGNSFEKRNAVILVGNAFGSPAHYYDMVSAAQKMYDCLTSDRYGFNDNEIHVLSQYDFSDIVDKTSTKEKLRETLDSIRDSDLFLFAYIGHGVFESYDSPQYFLLKNAEKLYDSDLQDYVRDIKGQHIYLLHACNSGGFIPELSDSSSNRIICASTGLGYLTTDYMLEGWIHFFIDALNGEGETLNDGFISIEEAFYYAEQKTYRKCDPLNGDLGQEPVLDDNGDNKGHSPHTGEYTRIPNNPEYDGHYASVNSLNLGPKELKTKQKTADQNPENIFQKLPENFEFIKNLIHRCAFIKGILNLPKNIIY